MPISIHLEGGGNILQICVINVVTGEVSYSSLWDVLFACIIFYNFTAFVT